MTLSRSRDRPLLLDVPYEPYIGAGGGMGFERENLMPGRPVHRTSQRGEIVVPRSGDHRVRGPERRPRRV